VKYKGMSRSHLFLVELIIVILFFAFSSIITVQVFGRSFHLDNDTTALNGAVIAVQTVAETDKNTDFKDIDPTEKTAYFSKEWTPSEPTAAEYKLVTKTSFAEQEAGTMAIYDYTAVSTTDNSVIYQLQTKKYYSGESASSGS
jgi:hypothetical protein